MQFHVDAVDNTRCNLIAFRAVAEYDAEARRKGCEEGLAAGRGATASYYIERVAAAQRFGWVIQAEPRACDGIAFLIPKKEA